MFVYIVCINEYGSLSSWNAAMPFENIPLMWKFMQTLVLEKNAKNTEIRDTQY